jgi:hypothetical protein
MNYTTEFKVVLDVLLILFIHTIADFSLQTDWQAKNKSTNSTALFRHVVNYSACFIIPVLYMLGPINMVLFVSLTCYFHYITDAYTSPRVGKLHQEGDIHNMFLIIGVDQYLHTLQLVLTYCVLRAIDIPIDINSFVKIFSLQ